MENIRKDQNLQKEIINENHFGSSNINNSINSKKNKEAENDSSNQIKLGEFVLTPLESLIINKKMPYGFKFEIEENMIKSSEQNKNSFKKLKTKSSHGTHQNHIQTLKNPTNEDININLKKEHISNSNKKLKKVGMKDNSSNINNNNSESYKIMMKCYSGFNKIISNQRSNFFYLSKFPDAPSLSNIEKKIKNFEYKTINDFCNDLRKLWNFQFKNYAKDPNIYQNICKMSLYSDQICKELSNEKITENKTEDISNIKKRTEKIKKDLDEIKGNSRTDNNNIKDVINNLDQINRLANLIKELDKQQLKGIIPILSDKNELKNTKMFEFDLEQLPREKFKKLEEYVFNCINKNKKNHINNINTYNANKNAIQNNKINKVINKTENKTNMNNNKTVPKEKTSINKQVNNVSGNKINNINSNIKDKNVNNICEQKKDEKKIISEKKTFSDSDSISSDSSLSN